MIVKSFFSLQDAFYILIIKKYNAGCE